MNLYVFEDVHTVARYIHSIAPDMSPVKLHKGLYFLFAYYGAIERKEEEGVTEGTNSTAPYLFNADFEAWAYGAVQRDVYLQSKEERYFSYPEVKKCIAEVEKHPNAKLFIDDMMEQIFATSDFSLVGRSKDDESYTSVFVNGEANKISRESLIREYQESYL
jgi:uncharacterized phage-associated protein